MLELILVRHGETDSNKKGTYCGWTDKEMNLRGIEQVKLAADKVKCVKPDAIYSSPLKRAYETAQIVNCNFNMDIISSDNLKEYNFGIWEDLTYAEIREKYPHQSVEWEKDWMNYCMEGGESALQGYQRIVEFIDLLVGRHKCGTIILVTHLGCIKCILAHLLGMNPEGIWRFSVNNGSISRITINDEGFAYLTALNL